MTSFVSHVQAKPRYTLVRKSEGAPVTADSTDMAVLRNITTVAGSEARRDLANAAGWRTVAGFVRLTGGTTPTTTLQMLEVARFAEEDGTEKSEFKEGALTAALSDGDLFLFEVDGGNLFFRVDAVTGAPTKVEVFLSGGDPQRLKG